jgi:ribosome maturation factor RimP
VDVLSRIIEIIEPSLLAQGYSLVQVKLSDGARRKTLMVMAERGDGAMMSFDDCAEISNTVSALLDVEDPITGAYNLEVCSPGLDRPLTKPADYTRFAGQEIKAETIIPVNGRKRFRGILKGIKGDIITISMPEGSVELPFSHMRTARLIVNDEIVATDLKKQKTKG